MGVNVPGRSNQDLTKINQAIEQLSQGRMNCTGTFTLASGATSTVVKFPTIAPTTIILFGMPQTANAAAALATTYISSVSIGSFTVTHQNNGQTDRTFGFVALG